MRIAILVNSLPQALKIYDETKALAESEPFIILCPVPGESRWLALAKHLARVFLKTGRLKSLRLIFGRRVFLFQKPLDNPKALSRLKRLNLDVGLHKSGNIYREQTIRAFRLGILNSHIGLL
nr:hypothetical protein [Acidobacteriota bacterium]